MFNAVSRRPPSFFFSARGGPGVCPTPGSWPPEWARGVPGARGPGETRCCAPRGVARPRACPYGGATRGVPRPRGTRASRCRGMPGPRALARAALPGSAPPPPPPGSLGTAHKERPWYTYRELSSLRPPLSPVAGRDTWLLDLAWWRLGCEIHGPGGARRDRFVVRRPRPAARRLWRRSRSSSPWAWWSWRVVRSRTRRSPTRRQHVNRPCRSCHCHRFSHPSAWQC